MSNFSDISGREQATFDDDIDVRFVPDQHAELDFNSANSLKQQSVRRNVAPLKTHYPDSDPNRLSSFSLMLHAKPRSNKFQFYSLWIDASMIQTQDVPHSRQAC